MSIEFEIVPAEERPATRRVGPGPAAISLALVAGHTVFIVGKRPVSLTSSRSSYAARRGYRIHVGMGERNGVQGYYAWADPPEPKP